MIIQEDNRWKVVILFYKKNGACVFWPRILSFLAGKFDAFEQILLTEPIMKKLYFFLDGKIAIFFLTTLNIILNCPTKSQNIICLSFSPWFWQMSLSSDSQHSCKNTFVFRNRPFPQRNHSLPCSIADIQESVCKKWK